MLRNTEESMSSLHCDSSGRYATFNKHSHVISHADQFTDILMALRSQVLSPMHIFAWTFIVGYQVMRAAAVYANNQGLWAVLRCLTCTELLYECAHLMSSCCDATVDVSRSGSPSVLNADLSLQVGSRIEQRQDTWKCSMETSAQTFCV